MAAVLVFDSRVVCLNLLSANIRFATILSMAWTQVGSSVTTAFLASLVEFVEALTIVLAVGVTRGWKSSFLGTGLGVVFLFILILVFGPILQTVPIHELQLAIGRPS